MTETESWTFVHAADLHIDSPLKGLARYGSAPVEAFRRATRDAFEAIVDLCIAEDARLLLLAGDVFDADWRDYNTGLFFRGQLVRLRDAGIRVFMVRGNHDARNEVTRHLDLPEGVHEFPADKASTVILPELEAAIHGQSFVTRTVTDNLAAAYPDAEPGHLNIGLLHTNVGARPGHDDYAPCSIDDLIAKGYDYWALGHVHEAEVLSRSPWIVYPGCSQGRSVRELGAKGCFVVTVEGGRIQHARHVPTDAARWSRERIELSPGDDSGTLLERAGEAIGNAAADADGRPLALRLRVEGPLADHAEFEGDGERRDRLVADLRAIPQDLGEDIWMEKIELAVGPDISLERLRQQGGVVSDLVERLEELMHLERPGEALGPMLDELGKKQGVELAALGLDAEDAHAMRELLVQVRALLMARMASEAR
jgi:DNA repair exonuclease SbcCD nuclease subunit